MTFQPYLGQAFHDKLNERGGGLKINPTFTFTFFNLKWAAEKYNVCIYCMYIFVFIFVEKWLNYRIGTIQCIKCPPSVSNDGYLGEESLD